MDQIDSHFADLRHDRRMGLFAINSCAIGERAIVFQRIKVAFEYRLHKTVVAVAFSHDGYIGVISLNP